jgi:hypothetical protein
MAAGDNRAGLLVNRATLDLLSAEIHVRYMKTTILFRRGSDLHDAENLPSETRVLVSHETGTARTPVLQWQLRHASTFETLCLIDQLEDTRFSFERFC